MDLTVLLILAGFDLGKKIYSVNRFEVKNLCLRKLHVVCVRFQREVLI